MTKYNEIYITFIDIRPTMKRLHEVTQTTDQRQLAAVFNVRQSTISDVLRRNRIPLDWLLQLQRTHGISPLWIITGTDEQHISG